MAEGLVLKWVNHILLILQEVSHFFYEINSVIKNTRGMANDMCLHIFRIGGDSGVMVMVGDFKSITILLIIIIFNSTLK